MSALRLLEEYSAMLCREVGVVGVVYVNRCITSYHQAICAKMTSVIAVDLHAKGTAKAGK